jgi:uncharacterized delta-60 repeat protein
MARLLSQRVALFLILALLTIVAAESQSAPGSVDLTFSVRFGGVQSYLISNTKVYAIALGPNDEIFVGGHFTVVNDTLWNGIARLNNDGSLNQSFHPPTFRGPASPFDTNTVPHIDTHQIFVQPNGVLWVGFEGYNLTHYLADGTPVVYSPANISNPSISVVYPDGRTLVMGNFLPGFWVRRYNSDVAPDLTFEQYATHPQTQHLLLRDGSILLASPDFQGGNFYVRLERRLADGTLDSSFHPPALRPPTCCEDHPFIERANGQIYVSGYFFFGPDTNKPGVVRLKTDGTLDSAFNVDPEVLNASKRLRTIALQPNGKIVVAAATVSQFGTGWISETTLHRLTVDGSADSTFDPGSGLADSNDRPGFSVGIPALAVQRDGKILVGGDFQKFNGISRDGLVRLYGDRMTPVELSATRTVADTLQLQLTGSADIVVIESTGNLSSPNWHPLTTIALSETNLVSVLADEKQSFYRARPVQ